MIPDRIVAQISAAPWFGARWSPYVLLDADLRIRASNAAFSLATGAHPDLLRDQLALDVFPAHPTDPDAQSVDVLTAAVEGVLRTGRPSWLGPHRHDLPHPHQQGAYVYKVWLPVELPVTERGRVVGVLHHVQDLTAALNRPLAPADPQHAPGMAGAVQALCREFPHAALETVLGLVTDSHRTVLSALGVPDATKALTLARLRLEVLTGRPAGLVQPGS